MRTIFKPYLVLCMTLLMLVSGYASAFAEINESIEDSLDSLVENKRMNPSNNKVNNETSPRVEERQQTKKYTNGYLIYVYSIDKDYSVTDNYIPAAELGFFTAKRSEYKFFDITQQIKTSIKSSYMFRICGYLYVANPGVYTFLINAHTQGMYGSVFINEKLFSSKYAPNDLSIVTPAKFDKPGLYPVDIRICTGILDDLTVSGSPVLLTWAGNEFHKFRDNLAITVKSPTKPQPEPIHRVLLIPLNS